MGPTIGPIFAKAWVQLLHNNGLLPQLPNLTLDNPRVTCAGFAFTSED
jgi:hypothetical protein